jgi:hypothetical protein
MNLNVHSCLLVYTHIKLWEPLNAFSWNLLLEDFMKYCQAIWFFILSGWRGLKTTLYEVICLFVEISVRVLVCVCIRVPALHMRIWYNDVPTYISPFALHCSTVDRMWWNHKIAGTCDFCKNKHVIIILDFKLSLYSVCCIFSSR